MRTNTLSVLFVIVMAMGFSLNEAFGGEVKFFEATEEEVASACSASGGTPYSDDSSGYGCDTDNAWVSCSDGSCMGQIIDDSHMDAQRSPAVMDWNKVTQTTFVGVMSKQSRRQTNCPNMLGRVRILDQKSQGLITKIRKLSPVSKSTAVKSLIRRSRSAKPMHSSKMAQLKRKVRAKMLGRQRHLAALTGQLKRNTIQRKNLWRQCNARVSTVKPRTRQIRRQTPKTDFGSVLGKGASGQTRKQKGTTTKSMHDTPKAIIQNMK